MELLVLIFERPSSRAIESIEAFLDFRSVSYG